MLVTEGILLKMIILRPPLVSGAILYSYISDRQTEGVSEGRQIFVNLKRSIQ